jgi:competence protein ComEA
MQMATSPGGLASVVDAVGRRRLVTWAVAAIVATAAGWWLARPSPDPVELSLPSALAAPSSTAAQADEAGVYVHIAGAVTQPGVYRVLDGARVTDLIDAAGGPQADADLDQLNLAAPVLDGSRIVVPRVGEVLPAGAAVGAPNADATPAGPLDLNAATVDQLDELPGVGPSTAAAIVAHRDEVGGYQSVDELLDVRGIGPAKLDAIRDLVTV